MSVTRSRLLIVGAALAWSISGLILKSLPGVHWLAIAGTRSLFTTLVFLPGVNKPRPPAWKLLLAGLLFAALVSTLMGSMQLGTAAQGIWLQYIAPALVALWSWLVCRQRLRVGEIAAAIITAAAVLVIATSGGDETNRTSIMLGLLSGVAFAAFMLLLKSLARFPAASVNVWINAIAGALLFSLALIFRVSLPDTPREVGALAIMATCQLGLGYYLFTWGISGVSAVEASLIALLEPICNPIWVYLFIGELPAPRVILGCGLIAAGLVVFALGPAPRRVAELEPAE
jgi:drug/metabolite transporter (DMT)-like permease